MSPMRTPASLSLSIIASCVSRVICPCKVMTCSRGGTELELPMLYSAARHTATPRRTEQLRGRRNRGGSSTSSSG